MMRLVLLPLEPSLTPHMPMSCLSYEDGPEEASKSELLLQFWRVCIPLPPPPLLEDDDKLHPDLFLFTVSHLLVLFYK